MQQQRRNKNNGDIQNNPRRIRVRCSEKDAAALGINRTTLWRVMNGKVINDDLLRRYQNLILLRHKHTADTTTITSTPTT